jgi:hypothetical protein
MGPDLILETASGAARPYHVYYGSRDENTADGNINPENSRQLHVISANRMGNQQKTTPH